MRFYGQWDPPVDQFIFQNYFKEKKNGFFIECGAFDGITESCCKFFEEFMEWTGINIEPVPYIYDKLCSNRPESNNIRTALSNECAYKQFDQAIHPSMGNHFGNGSISHDKGHRHSLISEGCKFELFDIECMTYRKLIEIMEVQHVDLFVLDVEGHELEVLDGMVGCKILPDVFCIEHGHLKDKLHDKVTSLGYKLDKTSFNNSFFIKN